MLINSEGGMEYILMIMCIKVYFNLNMFINLKFLDFDYKYVLKIWKIF